MAETTQWQLIRRPVGEPLDTDFAFKTVALPQLEPGQVLLRTIYLSLDPYMRGRMSEAKSYANPVELGHVMVGGTVSEVLESRSERRRPGDIVVGYTGWQTHAVVDARETRSVDIADLPMSTALGVLGMPGFTAYAGLLEIGRPQPGETLVVAAGTGPVGSAVGQIAKIKGARAVGVAGGPEKVRALIETFGFDAALDHRSPTFRDDLAQATPDGIDVYFENVGGQVSRAVAKRLNKFARIPVCGLVAGYNEDLDTAGPDQLPGFMRQVLVKSLTVRGFIQDEFQKSLLPRFREEMSEWVASGAVRYREDIVRGLENAPEAFRGLLAGRSFGKLLIQVSPDPN